MSDFPGENWLTRRRPSVVPISDLLNFPLDVSGGFSSEKQRLDAILIQF